MATAKRALGRVFGSFGRAVRWSLAPVEDEPRDYVVPAPGEARGPVRAITLRVDTHSRRARR